MIELANDALLVQLLDPLADRGRFGVRYCTGGYVFQVCDHACGDLLSGPTFPDSFNWYDGQGIPDSFAWSPLASATRPGEALVIGIGACDLGARAVLAFCDWQIERADTRVAFATRHDYEEHALSLVRTVALCGRTITSHTTLTNHGAAFVPVRWFPHPFYPQPLADELLAIGMPVRFEGDRGYRQAPSGFIARTGWPWQAGRYLPLDHDATVPPSILVRHPRIGLAAARLSWVPGYFPLWGNANTFSFEPFLERTLAAGQSVAWQIDYVF